MKIKLVRAIAFVSLLLIGNMAIAQNFVKGKITDTDGLPLIGASVVEKGTSNGTVTNVDGDYSLELTGDEPVLQFSFIGYLTEEVAVNGRDEINMTLLLNLQELSEVVVVGYGVQKKSDVTGAIVSVKSEDIEKTPSLNVANSLQGKAAGVTVTSNSGTPGGSVKVRIRGVGTIGDANPLYVVDGFPTSDIYYLNPGDIESIEVLKDASASAIYGARGANGVILVTTKKGQKGGSKITFTSYAGTQELVNQPNVLSGPQYHELMKQMNENDGRTFSLIPYANDTTHTTDWFNELTRPAPMQSYNLSIAGGNDKTDYLLSGSIFKQDGTVIGSSYDRQTFRFNLNSEVKDWLKVGNTVAMSRNTQTSVTEGSMYYGTVLNAMRTDPLTKVKNDSANQFYIPAYQDIPNPVAAREYDNYYKNYFRMVGNAFAEISFLQHFKLKSSFGLDLDHTNTYDFIPEQYYLGVDKYDRVYNTVSRGNAKYQTWLNENTLTFSKEFNEHNITALAGFTAQERIAEWTNGEKDSIPKEDEILRYFDAATGEARLTGSKSESAMISYLGRVNYSFAGKYLLTASIRIDGSSRFGRENRYGYFPSVSTGWNIHKESFMDNVPYVSTLKLRAGWGQIGNDKIGNYSYTSNVNYDLYNSYLLGGPNSSQYQVYGAAPDNFGNPFLQWETVESTNIGIDYGFLENRISGSLEYYIKNTKDMLVTEPVPEYVGFLSNPTTNIGEMQNKGVELVLTYREAEGEFTYDASLNITKNVNELVSLGKGQPITAGSFQPGAVCFNDVGHPVGSFYGFVTDGIFQTDDDIANYSFPDEDGNLNPVQPKAQPGDLIYKDLGSFDEDGNQVMIPDGKIDDADKTFIGNPLPDFTYGLSFNCAYKGFDLSLFIQGSQGNDVFNAVNWYLWHTSEGYNRSTDLLNSWTEEGSTNEFPRLSTRDRNGNNRISDRYVEDGSYVRLKNLQLGYSLPQSVLSTIGLEQVRIYVGAQNLLTFTKYSGLDPEIGNLYSDLSAGVDLGTYPQSRILQVGTKIVF